MWQVRARCDDEESEVRISQRRMGGRDKPYGYIAMWFCIFGYNCQVYGHYARDCTEPRKERAHLAVTDVDDEPALL
jgi:hypothetical protein